MKSRTKYKFSDGIWVTGFYNGFFVIGRTCITAIGNTASITNCAGAQKMILFDDLSNVRKLIITSKIDTPVTSTFSVKPKLTLGERLIVDLLKSINN